MKPNVALVDDDEVYIYLTRKTIEKTGLVESVHEFRDGMELLNFLMDHKDKPFDLPDLIFLDLWMPVMDGWEFLEQFAKFSPTIDKKITIYVCSSSISPEDLKRATAFSEVSDYIIKPLTKDKLLNIFSKLDSNTSQ